MRGMLQNPLKETITWQHKGPQWLIYFFLFYFRRYPLMLFPCCVENLQSKLPDTTHGLIMEQNTLDFLSRSE